MFGMAFAISAGHVRPACLRCAIPPESLTMILDAIEGAAAGLAATAPMTGTMKLAFKLLPIHQQYSLPPRQITARIARQSGVWKHLDQDEKRIATWVAHYAYGATMGAIYGVAVPRRQKNVLSGMGFGLIVWLASYLGLLPSLNILQPATRHPTERNLLMIAAHLVWGVALGRGLRPINVDSQSSAGPGQRFPGADGRQFA
jgi:hypothetical protein